MATKLDNPKHEQFAQLLAAKRLSNADAYKGAYSKEMTTEAASASANRLLKNAKVAKRVEEIEVDMQKLYKKDAHEAYQVQKSLMKDKQSPANVRLLAAKDIQDRAGLGATHKTESISRDKYDTGIKDFYIRNKGLLLLGQVKDVADTTGKSYEELLQFLGLNERELLEQAELVELEHSRLHPGG